ncbi:hypothetical protein NA57DRAFT_70980 [Rhizodiscina lignyota]|uniref:SRP9 domain-containing protein n=1 Tax=Rhizodiscina lignyota TaxID=1504668 RepID=A0A9P4IPA1_9PEZI|nr:hypothetical protein NA57DRAFT_70980 [Rhizodiscina lignyota]
MPFLPTSQQWLEQSSLLLKARPSTTKITTRYTVEDSKSTGSKRKRRTADASGTDTDAPAAPKAVLILKTFDPASGVCLKYQTQKAQEVGRLVGALGRLSRNMAALPETAEEPMLDAPTAEQGTGTSTPIPEPAAKDGRTAADPKAGQGAGGGGGGKKKKKGKK